MHLSIFIQDLSVCSNQFSCSTLNPTVHQSITLQFYIMTFVMVFDGFWCFVWPTRRNQTGTSNVRISRLWFLLKDFDLLFQSHLSQHTLHTFSNVWNKVKKYSEPYIYAIVAKVLCQSGDNKRSATTIAQRMTLFSWVGWVLNDFGSLYTFLFDFQFLTITKCLVLY